jgi:hypothetical protein
MNVNRKTAINEEGNLANTNRQAAVKESKMKVTPAKLIRWAGLPAMAAGILFIIIQPIHPPDVLASVTTSPWAIIETMKFSMALLGLLGILGIYARQVEKAGWLGLAGYLMFSLWFALTSAFAFIEAFVFPMLAAEAPKYVASILDLTFGITGKNLGAMAVIYPLAGIMFMLGGLTFGIATFRARVLPRWAGALFAFGAIAPPVISLVVPHPYNRLLAAPIGLAMIWLGYALLSERRAPASQPLPEMERSQLSQSAAD